MIKPIVAIQPDNYDPPSSPIWAETLEKHAVEVRWVDVFQGEILKQLQGCQGFMWRWGHYGGMGRIARRLFPVLEFELGMTVYPDLNSYWFYDDKIAESMLFEAIGIPSPKTTIWFDRWKALEWAENAPLPLVMKLSTGAGAQNARLIQDRGELKAWIHRMFTFRLSSLEDWERVRLSPLARLRKMAGVLRHGVMPDLFDNGYELQTGYIYLQEYLPGNEYDTRIVVVGNRAFGFRRYNRPGDFRASGAAREDIDPAGVDERFIRLAFKITQRLRMHSCAIDGLYRGNECVVSEISYAYPGHTCRDSLGHWELEGEAETGTLTWVEGQMWPEEAQAVDFIARLKANIR